MEGAYANNEWQQSTQKNLNYKPEGRTNIERPQTRCEDDLLVLMMMVVIK